MSFRDHFSQHADEYSRCRPRYPNDLFGYLASVSPGCRRAWDCGTGNGQAATALASFFEQVLATDASVQQLARAIRHPRVLYLAAASELAAIESGSVDLILAASALHWFDLSRFYAEVRRVARPGGLLAAWCYSLLTVESSIDRLLGEFYTDKVGRYWPPERRYVDQHYRSLPFPFEERPAPPFRMEAE